MAGLCALLLCWAQAVGGQRELRGWSLQTRISNGTSGSVDPNLEPLPGSCLNGTIIRYLEARSVAECELACGYTPGCRWFSYCASHLDVALPVAHAYDMHYCRFESLLDGTVEPMSAFGYKKDKCVLFSQCRRTGTNMNGSLPYVGFYIYEFGARSVMTGRNTAFFPDELPEKLKSKFHVPDSLHPNLRFWFTPEQLDSEGHVDGDRVSVWKNVANICYRDTGKGSHPEWLMTNGSLSSIQGHCRNAYSPVMRGTWAQGYGEVTNFVQTIGNSQKEILYQHAPAHMPQYRKNMAPNGHSALRFKRKDQDGTRGKFMYMYTMVGDKQGFEHESRNPFGTKSHESSNVPSYRGMAGEFTLFLVAKTFSNPGDRYFHGLLNIISSTPADQWKGLSVYKNSATCVRGQSPDCSSGFTSFSALNMVHGADAKQVFTDCSQHCGRQACSLTGEQLLKNPDCACHPYHIHEGCAESLGPEGARHLQDPDAEWRLISIRSRDRGALGAFVEGFIDGFHASPQPPFVFRNTRFEQMEQMRIGLIDQAGSAQMNFLNGDIAELLIYNKALTTPEMDRIANYLKNKYNLNGVRLTDDILSPMRSVSVSKAPGCGGNTALSSVCTDTTKLHTPYSKDAPLEVHHGEPFDVNRGYCPNPTPGQKDLEVFTISGWWLLPTDLDLTGPHQTIPSGVHDLDQRLHEQYLLVTIGEDEATEADCHIHSLPDVGSWVCESTGQNWGKLGGIRHSLPIHVGTRLVNNSNVLSRRLVHPDPATDLECEDGGLRWIYPSTGDGTDSLWTSEDEGMHKPSLRCQVLGGIRQGKQVNIYWHGIKTVVTAWRSCRAQLHEGDQQSRAQASAIVDDDDKRTGERKRGR